MIFLIIKLSENYFVLLLKSKYSYKQAPGEWSRRLKFLAPQVIIAISRNIHAISFIIMARSVAHRSSETSCGQLTHQMFPVVITSFENSWRLKFLTRFSRSDDFLWEYMKTEVSKQDFSPVITSFENIWRLDFLPDFSRSDPFLWEILKTEIFLPIFFPCDHFLWEYLKIEHFYQIFPVVIIFLWEFLRTEIS